MGGSVARPLILYLIRCETHENIIVGSNYYRTSYLSYISPFFLLIFIGFLPCIMSQPDCQCTKKFHSLKHHMSQDKLLISKRKCHFYRLLELTGHNDSITAVIPCEASPAISNYKTLAAQHIMWLLLFVQINIKPLDATGISHQPLNVFFSGRHIMIWVVGLLMSVGSAKLHLLCMLLRCKCSAR